MLLLNYIHFKSTYNLFIEDGLQRLQILSYYLLLVLLLVLLKEYLFSLLFTHAFPVIWNNSVRSQLALAGLCIFSEEIMTGNVLDVLDLIAGIQILALSLSIKFLLHLFAVIIHFSYKNPHYLL